METPTPAETREAERIMTPVQAVMTRARFEIMSHQQDMAAAGISESQVETASVKAGERAKLEFEQKEKEDPLRQIARVLEESAETSDEKLLAQQGVESLERFRSGWKALLQREELKTKHEEATFDVRRTVGEARAHNMTPSFVDTRAYGPGHGLEDFPSVRILDFLFTGEDNKTRIEPTNTFKERILRELGVLEGDQTLEFLTALPSGKEGYRGPVYRYNHGSNYAERLPTNVAGLDLRVNFGDSLILVSMDTPTLQKVVNFPSA